MSADKNHEQYLEEIEIAVAQTTKVLMEEHNSDLRKLAKVCAEKQLQVKRLKEFQENDRSTIHSLRAKLAEAIEEIECRNSTWETKEGEYEGEIAELKFFNRDCKEETERFMEENKELKEAAEIREDWIHNVMRCLEVYDEWEGAGGDETADDLADRVASENKKLKEEIEFLKNQLDVGGMMNFSKYND